MSQPPEPKSPPTESSSTPSAEAESSKDASGKKPKGGMSNLVVRFATAGVVVPIIIALLFWAPKWGFAAFCALGSFIAASELYGMTAPGQRAQQVYGVVACLAVFGLLWSNPTVEVLASTLVGVVVLGFFSGLLAPDPIESAAPRMAWLTAGPLYAGALVAALALVHQEENGGSWVVLAMVLAWFGDTGAYFAGRGLGKHKLYPKVSPNKTVEGAVGGLLGSVGGAVGVHFLLLPELPLMHAIPLALVAGVCGQAGDLTISLIKRSSKVKDSGWIVPGHGGLLDRVDGLLMTGAVVYVYVTWLL